MSVNSVVISGNLGREPEMRTSQSGTPILSFSVAVNERVKKDNEWTDYANWVGVVVFGRRAESLGRILTKGSKVAVSGHLHYSTWEKDGQNRSKIEVIADEVDIMQHRDNAQHAQAQQQPQYQQPQYQPQYQQPQYQPQYQQPYQQGYEGNF